MMMLFFMGYLLPTAISSGLVHKHNYGRKEEDDMVAPALCWLPMINILIIISKVLELFGWGKTKEKQMSEDKVVCIVKKKIKIHVVEGVPFYIKDGKVHNIPEYKDGCVVYSVTKNGRNYLQVVTEEV